MSNNPIVTITMNDDKKIVLELYPTVAPESVKNFISLIQKGFYDGLGFHRIIPGFMIQGGGFEPGMRQKETRAPIENGLAIIGTPSACSISNVSRALWPTARMRRSQGISSSAPKRVRVLAAQSAP